ncbi:unnamed protein product [Mytilus edulis]|uniref:PARP catalytic domain-containing protein n=1 Tax=Mytilus edulis TaxID=6550 RepID=A0A8S3V3Q0_MYTED|nr:unnamed protein product [Mytilus edulis]
MEIGIDNFFEFPLRVRLTTAIIPVGLIFLIGGLGSPSWSRSELSQLGLWKSCSISDIFTCCNNLPGGSPGTPEAKVSDIAHDGLDGRLAGNGMFGRGIYVAECPTKSDHYTGTDMTNLKMIVVRMLLGEIYVTNVPYSFQKPPCKQCIPGHLGSCDKSADKQGTFDSVMAAINGKHREFITYEQNSCSSYPEYIITYNRE